VDVFSCTLRAELELDASADEVWRVLTDYDAYPRWNPVVVRVGGEPREGARASETVRTDRGREMTFTTVVLTVTPGRELARRGRPAVPGLFTGVHRWQVTTKGPGRVLVVQTERLTGLLVPLLRRRLATVGRAQFHAVNQALARQVADLRRSSASTDTQPPGATGGTPDPPQSRMVQSQGPCPLAGGQQA
jgi:hypothetical protein